MKNSTILIVEDEKLVAEDLERRLTRLGCRVAGIADNGEAAVERALTLRPDLVLMDIRIQGQLDGMQVAGQLRRPHPIPVVFISSQPDHDTIERAGYSEPFGYIVKPLVQYGLEATVRMAIYRVRAEERFRNLERWLAATLRGIGDAVIATDKEGRVTYVNPAAETLTGWTPSEALGRPWQDVFHVVHTAAGTRIENLIERSLQEGIVVNLDPNAYLVTKGQQRVPVDHSVAPIRNDEADITGCVIVFRNATERRQMEAKLQCAKQDLEVRVTERTTELETANTALQSSNEQLQALNKDLESFSYSVSHDLRAPLRAIHGFTAILKESHSHVLDGGGQRLLSIIGDNSDRMGEMIDGFLALARTGGMDRPKQPVNMQKLVQRLVEERQEARSKTIARFELAPLPEAFGDESLLGQVWANLLDNALKFSARRQPAVIQIGGHVSDGQCHYFVRDNGVGFDMKYADKLFGVFQRLHATDEFTGHGLGLANVQRIIHSFGGRVWAESEPEKGATFHFSLPLAAAPTKQP